MRTDALAQRPLSLTASEFATLFGARDDERAAPACARFQAHCRARRVAGRRSARRRLERRCAHAFEQASAAVWKRHPGVRLAAVAALHRAEGANEALEAVLGGFVAVDGRRVDDLKIAIEDDGVELIFVSEVLSAGRVRGAVAGRAVAFGKNKSGRRDKLGGVRSRARLTMATPIMGIRCRIGFRAADRCPSREAKYRVPRGDGCLQCSCRPSRGSSRRRSGQTAKKVEFEDTPVASDAPECWLGVRLVNNLSFDDKYAREFPGAVEAELENSQRLGKWSIAFNLRDISAEGVAKAYFVDEWWKDIESASCSGSGKIVARYIMATRTILAKHAPQIRAAPAAQSAVCDPLKYDKEDPVPSFDGMAVDNRIAAFRPIYDELKKLNFTHGELIDNTVKEMPRPWNKQHGPLVEAVRKLALQKLFQAGRGASRTFKGWAVPFPLLVDSQSAARASRPPRHCHPGFCKGPRGAVRSKGARRLRQFYGLAQPGLVRRGEDCISSFEECGLADPTYKTISDTHFEAWFRSELYLQQEKPINGEMVYSRHPLHLEEFKLDVISAGAHLANKYGDQEWFKGNKIERFTEGNMP